MADSSSTNRFLGGPSSDQSAEQPVSQNVPSGTESNLTSLSVGSPGPGQASGAGAVPRRLAGESDSLDSVEDQEILDLDYQASGFVGQLLGRSKSWLASLVIHLAIILGLALLTTQNVGNPTVLLQLASDDFSELTELDSLEFQSPETFETTELEVEQQSEFEPELPELSSGLELPELNEAEFALDESLAATSNAISQLNREVSTHDIESGDGGASFFGIDADGDSVVYIVDRSGSMDGPRWQSATYELNRSIQALKSDQKFFVFLFSGRCHPMPFMDGKNKLVAATDANKKRFKTWLLSQYPDDTTRPLVSLKRAIKMEPRIIFLLTDGQFYDNTGEYLERLARRRDRGSEPDDLVINTIGFYCNIDLENFLNKIALSFNGVFRSVQ